MDRRCTRRSVLQGLALAGAAGALAGCRAAATTGPVAVEVLLTDLERSTRLVVRVGGRPVEVRQVGGVIAARSLVCTHMGCTVTWSEPEGQYVCPCHDGRYDVAGKPVHGPPPAALDEVPVRIEGARVRVG